MSISPFNSSDGLVRPLNAPAGHQLLPGVQPGVSGGVVLASYVIVFGQPTPGGGAPGIFIYASGTSPGPGNPPVFSMTNATADPYGNAIAPGIFAGQFGGIQAGLNLVQNGAQVLGEVVLPTGAAGESLAGGLASSVNGAGRSFLQIFSAQGPSSPNNDRAIMTFFNSLGGSGAAWFIIYNSLVTATAITQLNGDFTGVHVNGVNTLTGLLPGTGTSTANPAQPETWHQATLAGTWTGSGSGVNGLFYRVIPDGSGGTTEIIADIVNTTATGNSTCFTLPAGYRPNAIQNHPAGWNNPALSNSATVPWVNVNTSGVVQVTGIQVANKEIFFHVFVPLTLTVAPPPTPPAFVQVTPGGTGTASPVTVTLPAPSTAGNTIVVWVVTSGGTGNGTVTGITLGGAAGNFAQLLAPVGNPGTAAETLMIWADPNCAGGQTSISVSVTAFTGSIDVIAAEFTNMPATATVDVSATANIDTGSAAWSSTATATSTHSPALAIGGVGTFNGTGMTITGPGAPWVNFTQVTSASTHVGLVAGYQILSSLTAVTYSGTVTAGTDYAAAAAVVKGN
jgi:hypothetical protein